MGSWRSWLARRSHSICVILRSRVRVSLTQIIKYVFFFISRFNSLNNGLMQ
ncbi:hypothetical protein B296_00019729 [Ensete ventricosum]|uniref:Uncharacterized protein n=1 Tax=Ensete ventricosum TaxID=4639 RepID=A0A426ZRS9_ENSVE|nr:hypothetical protein B296_00019729 [Ensete ventricosum]